MAFIVVVRLFKHSCTCKRHNILFNIYCVFFKVGPIRIDQVRPRPRQEGVSVYNYDYYKN